MALPSLSAPKTGAKINASTAKNEIASRTPTAKVLLFVFRHGFTPPPATSRCWSTNLLMIQKPKKPTTIQKTTLPTVSMPLLNAFGKLTTSSSVNFFGSVETRLMKPARIETA